MLGRGVVATPKNHLYSSITFSLGSFSSLLSFSSFTYNFWTLLTMYNHQLRKLCLHCTHSDSGPVGLQNSFAVQSSCSHFVDICVSIAEFAFVLALLFLVYINSTANCFPVAGIPFLAGLRVFTSVFDWGNNGAAQAVYIDDWEVVRRFSLCRISY